MKLKCMNLFYLSFTLILLIIWYIFQTRLKNEEIENKGPINRHIPNIIHYIIFNRKSINFITYLSILSALKVQKPTKIYIHINEDDLDGVYWRKLKSFDNGTVLISYLQQPTHIFGQPLSSVYHSSDVARINLLKTYGGIYLDNDVLVLKSLDKFRKYDMVVGWPDNEYIGTQVLIGQKEAKFLKMWLDGYKKYHPRDWYYNAGVVPTEILHKYPNTSHYETVYFGVHNLLQKLHSKDGWNWRDYFCVHLLSRHKPSIENFTEHDLIGLDSNFGHIAKWVLSL